MNHYGSVCAPCAPTDSGVPYSAPPDADHTKDRHASPRAAEASEAQPFLPPSWVNSGCDSRCSCVHSHGRAGAANPDLPSGRLLVAGSLTLCAGLFEFSVGRYFEIRAAQADGAHMMADTLFAAVAYAALILARNGVGAQRVGGAEGGALAEVLAFSLNLGAIVALLGYVGGGAAAELLKDGGSAIEPEGAPVVMMGVGLLALLVQGLNAGLLLAAINQSPGARSVFLHSVLDCISSVGVVVGAIIAMASGSGAADAVVSLAIAAVGGLAFARVLLGNLCMLRTESCALQTLGLFLALLSGGAAVLATQAGWAEA